MGRIIFASKNEGKIKEVREILNDPGLIISSLLDFEDDLEIIENGKTFEENAGIKAKKAFNYFGFPAIGDDSGLMVDQLNGRPGIFSARYSGEFATGYENNSKLINELIPYPEPHLAKFVCCAVYYDKHKFIKASGEMNGKIIMKPRGENGFGYDPLFIPAGFNKTVAELELKDKNKISHRSRAFFKLKHFLKEDDVLI